MVRKSLAKEETLKVADKTALYITTRLFWPITDGHMTELRNHCQSLNRLGYDVHLCSFLYDRQSKEDAPNYIQSVQVLHKPKWYRRGANIIGKSLFHKEWTLQAALYYSKENETIIRAAVKCLRPDVIIVDMVRLAPYLEAISKSDAIKILNIEDLLSERYKRQEKMGLTSSIAGQYLRQRSLAERIISNPIIKKMVLAYEIKRVTFAESYYAFKYDACVFISFQEATAFGKKTGLNHIYTIPIHVDYQYLADTPFEVRIEPDTMSFLGNFSIAANRDSLIQILDSILPEIRKSLPSATLKVVGNCPDEIIQCYQENHGVVFCGYVKDTRSVIRNTMLFLSPIAYGTGVKTKIVEAMAMGMPVITNEVGAENIDAERETELIVCDQSSDVVRRTVELLQSPDQLAAIGKNAQQLIKKRFDIGSIDQEFADLLAQVERQKAKSS